MGIVFPATVNNNAELKIITGNANRPLAQRIAEHLDRPLAACTVTRFSDGEVFVQIDENVRGSDLFIVQSTNTPAENLMELLMLIEAARRASAKRITAVIPYFGYARADRKDQPRVSITARLIANMITVAGADRVLTMDLHASQIQGFFDIPSDHLYSAIVFNDYFLALGITDPVVVSPDVGSIKMARAFAKTLSCGLAIIDKRRPQPNQAEVLHIIGSIAEKTVILRDDMVDTGGTLTEAAQAVRNGGALKIFACCTHPVLSGKSLERIAASPIERLLVADTIDISERRLPANIEVISTARLFAEAIARIAHEQSVSALFPGEPDRSEDERGREPIRKSHKNPPTARKNAPTGA
ncbi:MAG: ribose-phosphate pyrophosphokinase [candidate division Zixibacteria bacterium]|nr:ribose-phosphate pyrophosphokinase [candidate division Zixibacteria bacterium]